MTTTTSVSESDERDEVRARAERLLRESSAALRKSAAANDEASAALARSDEQPDDDSEPTARAADAPTTRRNAAAKAATTTTASKADRGAWLRFRSMLSAPTERRVDVRPTASSSVMEEIIDLLDLKDPKDGDYPRQWDEPGPQRHTKEAVRAIFFAPRDEPEDRPRPSLLKHGRVLVEGEARELMLFTNGFLLSRGDWEKFARGQIREYFKGMGKGLNKTALDNMLREYDCHYDGTLSKGGFEAMLDRLLAHPDPGPNAEAGGMSWRALGEKINAALATTDIARKLHVAFRTSDVETMRVIPEAFGTYEGKGPNNDLQDAKVWSRRALALHIQGETDPLVMTCERNRDVDLWAEAFAMCLSISSYSGVPPEEVGELPRLLSSWRSFGGEDDGDVSSSSGAVPSEAAEGEELPGLLRESLQEDGSAAASDAAPPAKDGDEREATGGPSDGRLSDEERNDNAAWRRRFADGAVFRGDYVPRDFERKEMEAIAGSLMLKDSRSNDPAIDSLFFPRPGDPRSVLLKRGPVLLNGKERELAVFTRGFLFSRIELDSLAGLLLVEDADSERQLERFREIDVDRSRSLDPSEIREFFTGIGMPLSKPALDHIMTTYDLDSDGVISWNEFKAMMHEMRAHKQSEGLTWNSLGKKLRGCIGRARVMQMARVPRKLDVAYGMADIERVENLGVSHSHNSRIFADSAWAHLTLAVHLRGKRTPILVTCAKPGHVEAWMEAFHACLSVPSAQERDAPVQEERSVSSASSSEEEKFDPSKSGTIVGFLEEEPPLRKKSSRPSLAKWSQRYGSAVNWDWSSGSDFCSSSTLG